MKKHLLYTAPAWGYLCGCLWYLGQCAGLLSPLYNSDQGWVGLWLTAGRLLLTGAVLAILTMAFKAPVRRHLTRWLTGAALLLTLVVGWYSVQIKPNDLFYGLPHTANIALAMLHPGVEQWPQVMVALLQTLYLAFMATAVAVPFAFILSFPAAANLRPRGWAGTILYYGMRTIATFVRSIEAIVWAIIFTVWVGIGPFAGMLALMVHSVASLIKLYSEQIESIDPGKLEAIKATGAGPLQVWLYGVIPQIFSPFLAFTIYRWDINVRMATIVGFVGGGGIGLLLQQQQNLLRWNDVGLIVLHIALAVWIMDILSARLRAKLGG